jgi:adenylate cyclase
VKRIAAAACTLLLLASFAHGQGTNRDTINAIIGPPPYDSSDIDRIDQQAREYLGRDLDIARGLAEKGIAIAEELGYKKGVADGYHTLGIIDKRSGKAHESFTNYRKALEIREQLRDSIGMSNTLNNIGSIYYSQEKYAESLDYMLKALKIREALSDRETMADSYANIGNIFQNQRNYNEAETYFSKSLELYTQLGNQPGIAAIHLQLGGISVYQQQYPKAAIHFTEALRIQELSGNQSGMADAFNNLGVFYYQQGKYAEAMDHFQSGLEISETLSNDEKTANLLNNIALVYIEQNELDAAERFLKRSLVLSEPLGRLHLLESIHEALALTYTKMEQHREALVNYKQYIKYRDSLYSQENTQKLALQHLQYEFEKREALATTEAKATNALAAQELKREKMLRNAFIGGFGVVLLFAGLFFRQKNRISSEKRVSEREQARSEELLLNILPVEVAAELKETGSYQPKTFSMVTVMFSDFKGFTQISEKLSAELLVSEVHACFSAFDKILDKHGVEKIKTVGDGYMCAGGLPRLSHTHAQDVVAAALEIRDFIRDRKEELERSGKTGFEIRIGVHTGPVVAGIVGLHKFSYDIWGDTVNLAARLEQNGEPGTVNISGTTYELVKSHFDCTYRGKVHAKNKGEVDMYFAEPRVTHYLEA